MSSKLYDIIFTLKFEELEDYANNELHISIKDAMPVIKEAMREEQVERISQFVKDNSLFEEEDESQNDEEYVLDEYGDIMMKDIWSELEQRGIVNA